MRPFRFGFQVGECSAQELRAQARAAEAAGFEVFVTADKNLRYQQNLSSRHIAILELWTNHRPTLEKHFPEIHAAVERITRGQYLAIGTP